MLSYRHIVVGTDLSASSARHVSAAVGAAGRFEAKRVHLVHVVQAASMLPPGLVPEALNDPSQDGALDGAQTQLRELALPATDICVLREARMGSPARELSVAADEHHADLVVVARRGHNALTRLVLGSVPNTLTRICNSPVLVLDDDGPAELNFERVLAAVDLSQVSNLVLENALAVARAYAGQVQVLSLFERPEGLLVTSDERLQEAKQNHQAALGVLLQQVRRHGVPIETQVARHKGPVPPNIVEMAKASKADLIVMGTSGRNAWHRMILGSTANHVLLRAPCPVLVVPPSVREESEARNVGALPASPALGGNSPC